MKKSLLGIAITTAMGVVAFSSVANAGLSFNGMSFNGTSLQGTANGIALHNVKVEGGQLVAVKGVVEK